MKRPRGYFGIGIFQAKKEVNVGSLWRSANIFGASFIFTIGHRFHWHASDTMNTPNHVPLFQYSSIEEFYQNLPHSSILVAVEMDGDAVPLKSYSHPERAVYLLGAEDTGLPPSVLEVAHSKVMVPTVLPYSLNVAVAGSIVLYDRYAKL